MSWTEKRLRELEAAGTIQGFRIINNKPNKNNQLPQPKKISKALTWLRWNLYYWANEKALTLEEEYQFSKQRKFRSDWAVPAHKILIEFEGGIFMQRGGHNSPAGVQRDIDKYKLAQDEDWRVVRLTAMNYKTVLTTLNGMIS